MIIILRKYLNFDIKSMNFLKLSQGLRNALIVSEEFRETY